MTDECLMTIIELRMRILKVHDSANEKSLIGVVHLVNWSVTCVMHKTGLERVW